MDAKSCELAKAFNEVSLIYYQKGWEDAEKCNACKRYMDDCDGLISIKHKLCPEDLDDARFDMAYEQKQIEEDKIAKV